MRKSLRESQLYTSALRKFRTAINKEFEDNEVTEEDIKRMQRFMDQLVEKAQSLDEQNSDKLKNKDLETLISALANKALDVIPREKISSVFENLEAFIPKSQLDAIIGRIQKARDTKGKYVP
jgi:hypothetical protein